MSKSFLYRTLPHIAFECLERYFRVEVEGLENLPKSGPAILLPNHSGFLGLDALLLSHLIHKKRGRLPRIMLHKLWFSGGILSNTAKSLGFVEASYEAGLSALEKNKILMLFPEGEEGNFKPSRERYQLKDFRRGFLRLAEETAAPIIPCVVIGAEEANLTLGQVRIFRQLLPIPLNLVPLPSKWKIRFLPPFRAGEEDFERSAVGLQKVLRLQQKAARLRAVMQTAIDDELKQRKFVFFEGKDPRGNLPRKPLNN